MHEVYCYRTFSIIVYINSNLSRGDAPSKNTKNSEIKFNTGCGNIILILPGTEFARLHSNIISDIIQNISHFKITS